MIRQAVDLLNAQETTVKEYDESFVRKLIEQGMIHEDGRFTVEFKSGTKLEL